MMTQERASELHHIIFEQALEIMKSKRIDYSGEVDPFKNFRQSEIFGVPPWKGALIRLMDKISRAYNLMESNTAGKVTDESLMDTIRDGANYLVIAYLLWLEATGGDNQAKEEAGMLGESGILPSKIRLNTTGGFRYGSWDKS